MNSNGKFSRNWKLQYSTKCTELLCLFFGTLLSFCYAYLWCAWDTSKILCTCISLLTLAIRNEINEKYEPMRLPLYCTPEIISTDFLLVSVSNTSLHLFLTIFQLFMKCTSSSFDDITMFIRHSGCRERINIYFFAS